MSRHRLDRRRRPGKLQCKSTPHRATFAQRQRRDFYGQMGGIGVAAAAIAIPLLCGGAAVVSGFPLDLSSPPSAPTAQRPLGPSWLPGGGVGLHTSPNPLFRVPLDGSVASSPEVLHTALSLSLPSSNQPVGFWVGTRWVSADPVVRPTEPCPSPVLDPVGFRLWFARWFPGHPLPTPPVTTPPVVTTSPVTAPPADTVPPDAPPSDPPPASPPSVETPPMDVAPDPVTQPVLDTPPVDLPPVVVDVPVLPPVDVDPPSVDVPPVEIPPVDTITDPVVSVVDQSQDATTGSEDSVPLAAAVDSIAAPVDGINESTLAGAEQHPTLLGSLANHSTSGNGESYVGKHRAQGGVHRNNADADHRRGDGPGRGVAGGRVHRSHGGAGSGVSRTHGDSGGKHRSDRVKSHSKSESSHGKSSKSHSKSGSSKSHSGGSKSHSSSGGSHGGGHRG